MKINVFNLAGFSAFMGSYLAYVWMDPSMSFNILIAANLAIVAVVLMAVGAVYNP